MPGNIELTRPHGQEPRLAEQRVAVNPLTALDFKAVGDPTEKERPALTSLSLGWVAVIGDQPRRVAVHRGFRPLQQSGGSGLISSLLPCMLALGQRIRRTRFGVRQSR